MLLTKELLSEQDYVLSERLTCQDGLEQYFSRQRAAGGSNHNPTTRQFLHSGQMQAVVKELGMDTKKGNCRRVSTKVSKIDCTKLQRRLKKK